MARDDRPKFDLEGVAEILEDVGSLPVPRSVRESKGERLPPPTGALRRARAAKVDSIRPKPPIGSRAAEARLRRRLRRAALTPEQLGRALGRYGQAGIRDPQRGKEAGPPLPGEKGIEGGEG